MSLLLFFFYFFWFQPFVKDYSGIKLFKLFEKNRHITGLKIEVVLIKTWYQHNKFTKWQITVNMVVLCVLYILIHFSVGIWIKMPSYFARHVLAAVFVVTLLIWRTSKLYFETWIIYSLCKNWKRVLIWNIKNNS